MKPSIGQTNPFKGNLDPGKLRDCIARHGAGKIPFVRMEASTNLIGGQPFSIANMRESAAFAMNSASCWCWTPSPDRGKRLLHQDA